MNNDLANFSVLTGLLVETATAVKLRLCEPIRQPPKGILYYKSSQGSRDLTCWIHNIMNNDLANFSVLTGLLVETATAVKLRLCEPIRQPPKGILYYK